MRVGLLIGSENWVVGGESLLIGGIRGFNDK